MQSCPALRPSAVAARAPDAASRCEIARAQFCAAPPCASPSPRPPAQTRLAPPGRGPAMACASAAGQSRRCVRAISLGIDGKDCDQGVVHPPLVSGQQEPGLPGVAPTHGLPARVKIVLIGDSGVGKSCLALRYVKGTFDAGTRITVGAAFLSHSVTLPDGNTIKFEIWDTAGQERYQSLAPLYYRGSHSAVVVYDVTDRESFTKAQFWIEELQRNAGGNIVLVLVGNKTDLCDQRQVSEEEGRSLADSRAMLFVETSAKTAANVAEVFESVAGKLAGGLPVSSNAAIF